MSSGGCDAKLSGTGLSRVRQGEVRSFGRATECGVDNNVDNLTHRFSSSSLMAPEIEPMAQQRVFKLFHDQLLPST